jgi:hypothetical protein
MNTASRAGDADAERRAAFLAGAAVLDSGSPGAVSDVRAYAVRIPYDGAVWYQMLGRKSPDSLVKEQTYDEKVWSHTHYFVRVRLWVGPGLFVVVLRKRGWA